MQKIRFTPLNIAVAAALLWAGLRFMEDALTVWQGVGIFCLILILIIADQFFRLLLKKLSRVWLVEGLFVVLAIVVWLIVTKTLDSYTNIW